MSQILKYLTDQQETMVNILAQWVNQDSPTYNKSAADKMGQLTAQAFVDAVKEHQPAIIGMSALLTTTRPKMEETIIALKEAGLRDQVKVMCGGAPVTRKFVEEIGGDGYGANAAAAVDEAKELVS